MVNKLQPFAVYCILRFEKYVILYGKQAAGLRKLITPEFEEYVILYGKQAG